MDGPFSFSADNELAVFDLTYTRLLGDAEETNQVRSTGSEAFVTVGGTTYRVPADELGSLRVANDDDRQVFDGLGIAGWVVDPRVEDVGSDGPEATRRITGEVDAADLLDDLARITGQLTGDEELAELSGDTADRLQDLVRFERAGGCHRRR